MKQNINILSFFDGMSCGQIALQRAGITYDIYFSSEIDKNSIAVTQQNFPKTVQLDNVKEVNLSSLPEINLLIGGSPCQSFSIANVNREGFGHDNGKLFFNFVEAKNELRPKYFLYENVASMCISDRDFISKQLGVEPHMLNSNLVSAQSRNRYYWTNIPLSEITNRNLVLSDVVESQAILKESKHFENTAFDNLNKPIDKQKINRIGYIKNKNRGNRVYSIEGKSICLTKNSGGLGSKTGLYLIDGKVRKLTAIECERLQTVPENYTKSGDFDGISKEISESQRISMLGNGWTVDILTHFFENLIF